MVGITKKKSFYECNMICPDYIFMLKSIKACYWIKYI